jgi:hypothetical protein
MEELKRYLLEFTSSQEESNKLINSNGLKIEFNSINGSKICIKEQDSVKNFTSSDVIQIESSVKSAKPEEETIERINKINPLESLGVFIYSPEAQEIIFRSVCNCPKQDYINLVSYLLKSPEGHLSAFKRFDED